MLRIQNGNNQVLHSECIHVHVYIFIYFYILCCKILLLTDIHVDIYNELLEKKRHVYASNVYVKRIMCM